MRIATWNVNSLKARADAVAIWLDRVAPDVVLLQETKLGDADVPTLLFAERGYTLLHHGEGRWNGVAIASRVGIADPVVNFGDGPVRDSRAGADHATDADSFDPLREARFVSAVCGGVRVASLYVPNGREVDSPWYAGKLRWLARLERWLGETCTPGDALLLGGDWNVAPEDADVWDTAALAGSTHVTAAERDALARLRAWGLADLWRSAHPEPGRFSWWDYRAGAFPRNQGMRIDLLYGSASVAARVAWTEIDRTARKGPPTPSDHAPVIVDLDGPGAPIDAGWAGAAERAAKRSAAGG